MAATAARPGAGPLFILPVRRHAELGVFMHLFGANLDLNRFPARPKHHGVNRLVAVRFRVGDVIIKFVRQMTIVGMHDPQRRVAILQTFSDDTYRAHIKQLIKSEMLLLHFAPDAIDMLRTPVYLSLHAFIFHF